MEDNKILEKIRKLFAVTKENGASEGEVENAMKLAQRLMMQHNIDAQELEISPLDIGETLIENTYLSNEPKYWIWQLLQVIADSFSCEVTRKRVPFTGEHFYRLIGLNEDRIIIKEIFISLLPIIRNLTNSRWKEYIEKNRQRLPEQFKKLTIADMVKYKCISSKSVFTGSYISGFLVGLNTRLEKDKTDFLALSSEKEKYALIVIKKDDLIQAYVKEKIKPKEAKVKGQKEIDPQAFNLGREDGTEESINKQLQTSNE